MTQQRGVVIEELAEFAPPWQLRRAFDGGPMVVLENPGEPSELGRHAFLCGDPFVQFESKRGRVAVGPPGQVRPIAGDPLEVLARLLATHRPEERAWRPGLPPFLGGAVGYLGYELLYAIEPGVPDLGEDDIPVPDAMLLFCTSTIASDLLARRTWLITQAFAATRPAAEAEAARAMASLARRIRERPSGSGASDESQVPAASFEPRVSREAYMATVRQAREHILAGDLFEVCTAQRFRARWSGDDQALYAALRAVNPAPFAAYLRLPGLSVLSASPERFLRLDRGGRAETRPVKGTRPRGGTPEEDARLRRELETSPKDRAENAIIIDVSRNDLGRVCEFGTVEVPEEMVVERHPFTFQMVSTVVGQLRRELGPVDLLRAAFPAGSMTGAPKIEAMKVIDSLEPVKRGVFAGSIGYLDFEGAMDLNVVIRTLVRRGDALTFHVGGAVVADSEPAAEYQETLDKAQGLIRAFELTARRPGRPPRD
jgi:para-aminobenzoate synthetase component 1